MANESKITDIILGADSRVNEKLILDNPHNVTYKVPLILKIFSIFASVSSVTLALIGFETIENFTGIIYVVFFFVLIVLITNEYFKVNQLDKLFFNYFTFKDIGKEYHKKSMYSSGTYAIFTILLSMLFTLGGIYYAFDNLKEHSDTPSEKVIQLDNDIKQLDTLIEINKSIIQSKIDSINKLDYTEFLTSAQLRIIDNNNRQIEYSKKMHGESLIKERSAHRQTIDKLNLVNNGITKFADSLQKSKIAQYELEKENLKNEYNNKRKKLESEKEKLIESEKDGLDVLTAGVSIIAFFVEIAIILLSYVRSKGKRFLDIRRENFDQLLLERPESSTYLTHRRILDEIYRRSDINQVCSKTFIKELLIEMKIDEDEVQYDSFYKLLKQLGILTGSRIAKIAVSYENAMKILTEYHETKISSQIGIK